MALLGAFDYSLMERCGALRLDALQLSMLLACALDERMRARLCADADLARLVATVERLWCELIAGHTIVVGDDDGALYAECRSILCHQ